MDRREEILSVAELLTQQKGLNGFSYSDISNIINIKTASIHYYFKTKDDLALALVERYHKNLKTTLTSINADLSPLEKLNQFTDIFKTLAQSEEKFCLCGMMSAELAVLSKEAHKELLRYFQTCIQWLSSIFSNLGSKHPIEDAKAFLALMEGALLLARVENDSRLIDEAKECFIQKFN